MSTSLSSTSDTSSSTFAQNDNELLQVTPSAIMKVAELLAEEENQQLKLRIYIEGGGCSGYQYGFTFDDVLNEDDAVIHKQFTDAEHDLNISLVIDAMSLQYLIHAEIDYESNVEGERFIIRNPNAKTTCGCGSSFSVE